MVSSGFESLVLCPHPARDNSNKIPNIPDRNCLKILRFILIVPF
jgi:hypothetical protein